MSIDNLKIGDSLWAVSYSKKGEASIGEWTLLASIDDYIIASYLYDYCCEYDNLMSILNERLKETNTNGTAKRIAVFLKSNCYLTKEDAMKACNYEYTFPDCPICANMDDENDFCPFNIGCVVHSKNGVRYGTPSHWKNY